MNRMHIAGLVAVLTLSSMAWARKVAGVSAVTWVSLE